MGRRAYHFARRSGWPAARHQPQSWSDAHSAHQTHNRKKLDPPEDSTDRPTRRQQHSTAHAMPNPNHHLFAALSFFRLFVSLPAFTALSKTQHTSLQLTQSIEHWFVSSAQ